MYLPVLPEQRWSGAGDEALLDAAASMAGKPQRRIAEVGEHPCLPAGRGSAADRAEELAPAHLCHP
ncbi:MAG TPA: hypothetical protein VJM77_00870 [Nitrospiria bacterium]|nr:hypothetical protein [Nitrospiria bacterium]